MSHLVSWASWGEGEDTEQPASSAGGSSGSGLREFERRLAKLVQLRDGSALSEKVENGDVYGAEDYGYGTSGTSAESLSRSLPSQRSKMMCANPNCWFLVHPEEEFGGFCCKKCHWRFASGSKGRGKKHGEQCCQQEAPPGALRSPPVPPEHPIDWSGEASALDWTGEGSAAGWSGEGSAVAWNGQSSAASWDGDNSSVYWSSQGSVMDGGAAMHGTNGVHQVGFAHGRHTNAYGADATRPASSGDEVYDTPPGKMPVKRKSPPGERELPGKRVHRFQGDPAMPAWDQWGEQPGAADIAQVQRKHTNLVGLKADTGSAADHDNRPGDLVKKVFPELWGAPGEKQPSAKATLLPRTKQAGTPHRAIPGSVGRAMHAFSANKAVPEKRQEDDATKEEKLGYPVPPSEPPPELLLTMWKKQADSTQFDFSTQPAKPQGDAQNKPRGLAPVPKNAAAAAQTSGLKPGAKDPASEIPAARGPPRLKPSPKTAGAETPGAGTPSWLKAGASGQASDVPPKFRVMVPPQGPPPAQPAGAEKPREAPFRGSVLKGFGPPMSGPIVIPPVITPASSASTTQLVRRPVITPAASSSTTQPSGEGQRSTDTRNAQGLPVAISRAAQPQPLPPSNLPEEQAASAPDGRERLIGWQVHEAKAMTKASGGLKIDVSKLVRPPQAGKNESNMSSKDQEQEPEGEPEAGKAADAERDDKKPFWRDQSKDASIRAQWKEADEKRRSQVQEKEADEKKLPSALEKSRPQRRPASLDMGSHKEPEGSAAPNNIPDSRAEELYRQQWMGLDWKSYVLRSGDASREQWRESKEKAKPFVPEDPSHRAPGKETQEKSSRKDGEGGQTSSNHVRQKGAEGKEAEERKTLWWEHPEKWSQRPKSPEPRRQDGQQGDRGDSARVAAGSVTALLAYSEQQAVDAERRCRLPLRPRPTAKREQGTQQDEEPHKSDKPDKPDTSRAKGEEQPPQKKPKSKDGILLPSFRGSVLRQELISGGDNLEPEQEQRREEVLTEYDQMKSEQTGHEGMMENMGTCPTCGACKDGSKTKERPAQLNSLQIEILRTWAGSMKGIDPAVGGDAVVQKWCHVKRLVPVEELRFSHGGISQHFQHGPHRGQNFQTLFHDLSTNKVKEEEITPLVVVCYAGDKWVICGNRRLRALRLFQWSVLRTVFVPCLLHQLEDAPRNVMAKFILSMNTADGSLPRVRKGNGIGDAPGQGTYRAALFAKSQVVLGQVREQGDKDAEMERARAGRDDDDDDDSDAWGDWKDDKANMEPEKAAQGEADRKVDGGGDNSIAKPATAGDASDPPVPWCASLPIRPPKDSSRIPPASGEEAIRKGVEPHKGSCDASGRQSGGASLAPGKGSWAFPGASWPPFANSPG